MTATNPRPELPLLGAQDHVWVPWWPHESCGWFGRKMHKPAQGLEWDVILPSLRVPGAWESPDYPISKLQSRLSASKSEIKDPSLCLVPPEPGRPGLSSVQTLWHHGADCWGNLLLGWEKRGRLRQFSIKGRKKTKPEKEKGTHNNKNSLFQAGWWEEVQAQL